MKKLFSLIMPALSLAILLAGCGAGGGGTTAGGSVMSGTVPPAVTGAGGSSSLIASDVTPGSNPTVSSPPSSTGSPTPSPTASPTGSPSPSPSPTSSLQNPFVDANMFVDPNSAAAQQVATWSTSDPADAAEIRKISTQPQAKWMSGNSATLNSGDAQFLAARAADGTVPVVVLYNIYERDYSGGLATGGAPSPSAYRSWIRAFAAAVGDARVITVLEPDALGQITKLPAGDQQTRYSLLNDAIAVLKSHPNIAVYVDAGNPLWVSASDMATRLEQAGVSAADGFSLNVSNFAFTSDNLSYGNSLSAMVGGKHFIVDTSRNGLGPAPGNVWANPPGRALGPHFTASTGDALCDAFVFIKNPGYSDGAANGGPAWGWWPSYALGLCQRAAY